MTRTSSGFLNEQRKKSLKSVGLSGLISLLSLILAIVVGGIVISLFGQDPIAAYSSLISGAFGTLPAFFITLQKSVPILLTGLAVSLAFKCSVFNIGAEGQLLLGAMAAAIVGQMSGLPAVIHIPLTLLSAMAAGMMWAFMPALLKLKANVHVVISTIMFNYIAQYFIQHLILGPFRETHGDASATSPIAESAELPQITAQLNIGIIIALVMVVAVWFLLSRTTTGYNMKAVGLNANAARVGGISVDRNMFLALLLSGALAGLAGGIEVTGSLGKIVNNFSPGYGFNGIPVALMARNNPFAIIITAILIGSMRSGSILMQASAGISASMVDVIQGLIIVFLCAEHVIRYYIKRAGRRAQNV